MDSLKLPADLVIGAAIGVGIGWGGSMWLWGEPHVGLITTMLIVLGVIGWLVEMFYSGSSK